MLQLTFGLPFWQCPVPSTLSFTEVNAAALTANAFGTTNSAAAAAATIVASLTAVHRRRRAPPESLLFIPAPPSSGSTWCAKGGAGTGSWSPELVPQSSLLSQPRELRAAGTAIATSVGPHRRFQQTAIA